MFTAFFKLASGLLDFRFDQNPEEQTTLTMLGPRSMLRVVSGQFKTSMIFRLGYLLSHCVPWTEFLRETLYPQNRVKGNWNRQDALNYYTTIPLSPINPGEIPTIHTPGGDFHIKVTGVLVRFFESDPQKVPGSCFVGVVPS